MKVLIVSKTHMSHNNCCVGGLAIGTSSNVRLLKPGCVNQTIETEYNIGELWEIVFNNRDTVTRPHIEDVIVIEKNKLSRIRNMRKALEQHAIIWYCKLTEIFEERLRFTANRSGYITNDAYLANGSVGFWETDRSFVRKESYGKIRYYSQDNSINIPYVGFEDPIDYIPKGNLLRLSLARWWRPPNEDVEKRCYLQLSGWFL